jgi:asparagine synthase (glutamine-hydrolysing)
VFNGEIYNYRELREDLESKGHRLVSDSDSECIPHLYEEYGLDFVSRLRGMFAIAIWDRAQERLVLVRDRLGKKPLFYRADATGLAFASELAALLVDERTPRDIDEVALSHYLTFQYVPAPWSIYKSVRKVPPGHMAVYQRGQVRITRYWTLDFAQPSAPLGWP